jgi:hypothetical protein
VYSIKDCLRIVQPPGTDMGLHRLYSNISVVAESILFLFHIKSYATLYSVLSVVQNVLLTTHNDDHMTNKGKLLSSIHSMIQQLNQKFILHCLRFHVHTQINNIYM